MFALLSCIFFLSTNCGALAKDYRACADGMCGLEEGLEMLQTGVAKIKPDAQKAETSVEDALNQDALNQESDLAETSEGSTEEEAKQVGDSLEEARPPEDSLKAEVESSEVSKVEEAKPTEDAQKEEAEPAQESPQAEVETTEDLQVEEAKPTEDAPKEEAELAEESPQAEVETTEDLQVEAKPTDDSPTEEAEPAEDSPREEHEAPAEKKEEDDAHAAEGEKTEEKAEDAEVEKAEDAEKAEEPQDVMEEDGIESTKTSISDIKRGGLDGEGDVVEEESDEVSNDFAMEEDVEDTKVAKTSDDKASKEEGAGDAKDETSDDEAGENNDAALQEEDAADMAPGAPGKKQSVAEGKVVPPPPKKKPTAHARVPAGKKDEVVPSPPKKESGAGAKAPNPPAKAGSEPQVDSTWDMQMSEQHRIEKAAAKKAAEEKAAAEKKAAEEKAAAEKAAAERVAAEEAAAEQAAKEKAAAEKAAAEKAKIEKQEQDLWEDHDANRFRFRVTGEWKDLIDVYSDGFVKRVFEHDAGIWSLKDGLLTIKWLRWGETAFSTDDDGKSFKATGPKSFTLTSFSQPEWWRNTFGMIEAVKADGKHAKSQLNDVGKADATSAKAIAAIVKKHITGKNADLSEQGYACIKLLGDDKETEAFIRRVAGKLSLEITNEGGLQGMVPFYSGTRGTQSYDKMVAEMQKNAKGSPRWLMPIQGDTREE